ncbi:hypothetical protein BH11PSE2_BH11PSE2_16870 [soil metagenome]
MTIEDLLGYLGCQTSAVLSRLPFSSWEFERSTENDVSKPRIDYVFPKAGIDLVSDLEDKIRTLFVHFGDDRCFEGLAGFSQSSTQCEMLERFGVPSNSGGGFKDPVLGDFGAWDRYSKTKYSIHIQYRAGDDRIALVTLMRADAVP